MGRDLISPLAAVQFGAAVGVHRIPLVRVDGHTEQTGVRLQGVTADVMFTESSHSDHAMSNCVRQWQAMLLHTYWVMTDNIRRIKIA